MMYQQQKTSLWFLGTSSFAVPSLKALAKDSAFSIDLVITQPDRPVGRKQELTPPPVKVTTEKLGLKILQTENINELPSPVPSPSPDFLVVVSFGQILSQKILDLPTIAPVNLHASLLPRWRGASPMQHAILAGDPETGVTIQRIVKELDAGPVLAQESMKIPPRTTYESLHDALAKAGAKLLISTLKHPLRETPQDESLVTLCNKLSRSDGNIDPATMTAQEIDRRVRALNPWPGVTIPSLSLKLLETSLEPTTESAPLEAKNSTLHLMRVQSAGGTPMTGKEWARGRQPK